MRRRKRRVGAPYGERPPETQGIEGWAPARLVALRRASEDAREDLPFDLAERGRKYRGRLGTFRFDDLARDVAVPVQGTAHHPYLVSMRLAPEGRAPRAGDDPDGDGPPLMAVCTCPFSDLVEPCKHTWAALDRLAELLAQRTAGLDEPEGADGGKAGKRKRKRKRGAQKKLMLSEAIGKDGALLPPVERPAAPAKPAPPPPPPEEEQRVVWRVAVGKGTLAVEPFVQQRLPRGGYGRPRKLGLEALKTAPELWTRDDVRDVAALISKTEVRNYSYRPEETWTLDPWAAVGKLVGSPHVSWSDKPDRRVHVRRGQLGLQVTQERGGTLRLEPILGRQVVPRSTRVPEEGGPIVVADPDASTLTVGDVDPRAAPVLIHLLSEPTTFSRDKAGMQLVQLAQVEQFFAAVRLPPDLVGRSVRADGRLRLLLLRRSTGVQVAARVRPSGSGPSHVPGEGQPRVASVVDSKWVPIDRALEAERALAERLVAELGLDREPPSAPFTWELDLDRGLDLLVRLEALVAAGREDVLLEWPEGQAIRVTREAQPGDLKVAIADKKEDRQDWFGIEGHLEVDGLRVPLERVLAAIRAKERYVAVEGGRWLRISQVLRDRLAPLGDVVHDDGRGRLKVDATAGPAVQDAIAGAGEARLSTGWGALMRRVEEAKRVDPTPPKALRAELRDYQREGFAWLKRLATWGVGACLADDMGLGKTVQTIGLLVERAELGPALVVAPTSLGFNWRRELERFAPTLRPITYRDTDRSRALKVKKGDVVLVSYDMARIDEERLAQVPWATAVFDEAQRVKNATSKTAQALRNLDAGWKVALTGTPLENHLGELWSLFLLISPGLLGTAPAFRQRFSDPIERDKDDDRRKALARTIRPFVLRRTKDEVLRELPSRTEVTLEVELSGPERSLYEEARLKALTQLTGAVSGDVPAGEARFQVLAALTRLRQLACHPRLVDKGWGGGDSSKLGALLELVEEVRNGDHRALVFSQFTQHLALIREALDAQGVSYLYLDGSTRPSERQRLVDAFQRGEGELFLISLKAGGQGLNLTGADYVIHMDPWWNPAVEDQATDRAHRIGQTKPVTVYRVVAQNTIEEQILRLHADKRDLVAGVLDGSDRAGKLSTEELLDLIRLGTVARASGRDPGAGRDGREGPAEPAAAGEGAGDGAGPGGEDGRSDEAAPLRLGRGQAAARRVRRANGRIDDVDEPGAEAANGAGERAEAPSAAADGARPARSAPGAVVAAAAIAPPAPTNGRAPCGPDRVRSTRDQLGLSQGDLGKLLGVTGVTIGRWERGVTSPPDDVGPRLEELCGLSARDLRARLG